MLDDVRQRLLRHVHTTSQRMPACRMKRCQKRARLGSVFDAQTCTSNTDETFASNVVRKSYVVCRMSNVVIVVVVVVATVFHTTPPLVTVVKLIPRYLRIVSRCRDASRWCVCLMRCEDCPAPECQYTSYFQYGANFCANNYIDSERERDAWMVLLFSIITIPAAHTNVHSDVAASSHPAIHTHCNGPETEHKVFVVRRVAQIGARGEPLIKSYK